MVDTTYCPSCFGQAQILPKCAPCSVAHVCADADFTPTQTANDKQVAGTHYKDMGVQPWDVVATWPIDQQIGAYRHGALKYLMRMGTKDEQLQEIRKCGHYVEKLIEVLEANK